MWRFCLPGPLGWFLYRYPSDLDNRYQQLVNQLKAENEGNISSIRISYVAHSFGCWALTQFLKRPNVSVYRVILCGSVARFYYKWPIQNLGLNADGSPSAETWPHVLNRCATLDPWPGWAWRLSGRYGTSGRDGFSDNQNTYSRWFEGNHSAALRRAFWSEWAYFFAGAPAHQATDLNPLNRDQPEARNPDFRGLEMLPRICLHIAWLIPLAYCLLLVLCLLGLVTNPWLSDLACPTCSICDSEVYTDDVRFPEAIKGVVVRHGLEREYDISEPVSVTVKPSAVVDDATESPGGPFNKIFSESFVDPDNVMIDFVNDRNADVIILLRAINGRVAKSNDTAVDHWRGLPVKAGQTVHDVRMSAFTLQIPRVQDADTKPYSGDYAIFVYDCRLRSLLGGSDGGSFPVHRLVPQAEADPGKRYHKVVRVLARANAVNSFVSVTE